MGGPAVVSRLFNVTCLVLCVLALMVAYSHWETGAWLERELVSCLDG